MTGGRACALSPQGGAAFGIISARWPQPDENHENTKAGKHGKENLDFLSFVLSKCRALVIL
jgi:hypothetical protein